MAALTAFWILSAAFLDWFIGRLDRARQFDSLD